MEDQGGFAARFRLALKAIGFSRGRAAAALNCDKSLVGRWASGAVRPSEHNLARITALVADHVAGFNMADWGRDHHAFAERIGIDPRLAFAMDAPPAPAVGLPAEFLANAGSETVRRGAAYEGFWRTTRPSVIMEGSLFHDHGMIRIASSGFLEVRIGGAGLSFDGWAFPAQGNIFAILYDSLGMTPLFLTFRSAPLPKIQSLDGLLMLSALDAGRTPAAVPIVLERIGDLSGDGAADDARYAELVSRQALAPEGEVPADVQRHLIRDVGPKAAETGGHMFLVVSAASGLSRGASATGELKG